MILLSLLILAILCFQDSQSALGLNISDQLNEFQLKNFILRHLNASPFSIISQEKDRIHESLLQTGFERRIIANLSDIPQLLVDDGGDYVIIATRLMELDYISSQFKKTGKWYSTSRFLILFSNQEGQNFVKEVFRILWIVRIYNAVVSTNIQDFYTWFPYAINNKCGTEFHLSKYAKKSDPFANRIPDKVSDCEFNMTISYFPMYLNEETNTGYISTFMDLICEKLNMTHTLLVKNFSKIIEITGDHSIIPHTMEMENIQAAHLLVSFDKRIECNFCEYTNALLRIKFMIMVPPRTRLPTNLLGIIPADVSLCSLTIITLFIVMWRFFNDVTWRNSLFDILQLLLTFETDRRLVSSAAKLLVMLVLLFGLLMNVIYSTGLSSILTSPELTPKITTIEQFLETDLMVSGDLMMVHFAEESYGEEALKIKQKYIKVSSNFVYYENIKNFLKKLNYAICLSSNTLLRIRNPRGLEILSDHPLIISTNYFIVKRNHPLIGRINYWIMAIHEAGLPLKWLYEYSADLEKFDLTSDGEVYRTLHLVDMEITFMFLVIGQAISFCVFLVEVANNKLGRQKLS